VSDTVRAFFAKLGYTAERRNAVFREGHWLRVTTMPRQLGNEASVAFTGAGGNSLGTNPK
jgi:hypothetical protein